MHNAQLIIIKSFIALPFSVHYITCMKNSTGASLYLLQLLWKCRLFVINDTAEIEETVLLQINNWPYQRKLMGHKDKVCYAHTVRTVIYVGLKRCPAVKKIKTHSQSVCQVMQASGTKKSLLQLYLWLVIFCLLWLENFSISHQRKWYEPW